MPISKTYVNGLPEIYRDILGAFPQFDVTRKVGHGLSIQSIYSALNGKYSLGEIRLACEQMAEGGAMEIKNEIFAYPTPMGEDIIAMVSNVAVPSMTVPPFYPPTE